MSLKNWIQYGWLSEHQSSREEIENLLGLVDRDLRDCQAKGLGADWSFAIAYNAALEVTTAALAAAGYRASGLPSSEIRHLGSATMLCDSVDLILKARISTVRVPLERE